MKKVQRLLLGILIATCILVVVMAVLFEFDVLPSGILKPEKKTEYLVAIVLEIATICVIPLALRLFKFGKIHRSLVKGKEKALARWGTLRLLLLCVPLVANALCYWLFMSLMSPTFAYMAIMLFICLLFIFPSMERCVVETTETVDTKKMEETNKENAEE